MPVLEAPKKQGPGRIFIEGAELSGQFALVPQADFRLLEFMRSSQGVPFFICAPSRTGRTSLALDYAQRQYDLDEVLWVDATDDGFLEAIRRQTMLEHLKRQIANGLSRYRLIAMDDLPFLSEQEASRFSDWVDQLIEDEIEVIIITTPQDDSLKYHQSDRLLIEGRRLILSQKWGRDRMADCLKCFFTSPAPKEIRVLAALMIIMGHGIVDNLQELRYQVSLDLLPDLNLYCPLIEVDELTGYFDTRGFPVCALAEPLIDLLNQAPRNGLDLDMSDLERSFERLTQMSVHLFERAEREQSQVLLELAGNLLTCDDAGFPLIGIDKLHAPDEYSQTQGSSNPVVLMVDDWTQEGHQSTLSQEDGYLQVHEGIRADAGNLPASTGVIHTGTSTGVMRASTGDKYTSLKVTERPEQLVIRLFGDFKVLKGGRQIEGKELQRSRVRTLLIHLALNMGRGVSRDSVLERIWPEKDYSHAKDNFYSTWSMLSCALSDGKKDSPYLSNRQGVCRLEPDCVTADVYEFERLSKAILFQQGSLQERFEAIYRLEQLYRGDILSGIKIDNYVLAAQSRYRSILVDVMIEASKLFSEEGNDTNAVWFARKAYDTDPSREDVYRTLMSMQDRAGQRTSALKTYFDCKRFLSEELGILPSQKTIALYQELVLDRR